MANEIIRPSLLPVRTNPVPSEVVPSDNNVTVGGVSWEDGVNAAVPPASEAESVAGVINSKRMTPLTTKQAIDAQVPPKISTAIGALNLGSASQSQVSDFATAAQGALANTAVQPSRTVSAGSGLTGGGTLAANRTIALNSASIASLAKADTSVQTVNGEFPDGAGNVVVNAEFLQDQDSVTTAMAESFASTVEWVRTAGYAAVGDGGEALYKRALSEPSHAGKFQSADGAWWELAEAVLRPEMFGDDGAAFDAALQLARIRGADRATGPTAIFLENGGYSPAGGFNVEDSLIYVSPGSSLYGNATHGYWHRINTLPDNFNAHSMDTISVYRYFDAEVKDNDDPSKTNGLLKAGAPALFGGIFGMSSPAIGTPLAIRLSMEVYDVGVSDLGLSEIGGIYNHIVVHGDRDQPPLQYSIWSQDNIAMTGRDRPWWFGASFRFNNMTDANPSGVPGQGCGFSGLSIMQRPLYDADAQYAGFSGSDNTYPMASGITVSGFGGPETAIDGTSANALHAFYVGVQVGGANSPYLPETARSKILTGISIQDYTLNALVINNPHPDFNPSAGSGAAIAIGADAGAVVIGVTPTQDATIHVRGAADGNIKLYALSGNKSATLNFSGIAVIGTDLGKSSADTFSLYHSPSGRYAWHVTETGHFALPALPTSAAGLVPGSGAVWSDSGTLKIV